MKKIMTTVLLFKVGNTYFSIRMLGFAVTRFVLMPTCFSYPFDKGGRLHLTNKHEHRCCWIEFPNEECRNVGKIGKCPHLITNSAESIILPQLLFARIPPFPTTAHVCNVLFGKGCLWNHNRNVMKGLQD